MTDNAIENIIITNEEQAWNTLQNALSNEISETALLVFEGWPVFKLRISGTDFQGSIPTRIMPVILDLQKEIHRIYCQAKYNTEDTRVLKQEERELLELVVFVREGSSEFITELFKVLNEIIKNSNMTGKQALILLISIASIISSNIAWKDWLAAKEREHSQEITVKLSQQETRRLEILNHAEIADPNIKKNKESFNQFRDDLAKKLKPSDQLSVENQPVITGIRAAEIVPAPRAVSQEVRIDGEFIINEVKFPKSFGGDYRFLVTRVVDRKQISVSAPYTALSDEQVQILKDGGFGIRKVILQINAKENRGNITAASLVSITWPDANN